MILITGSTLAVVLHVLLLVYIDSVVVSPALVYVDVSLPVLLVSSAVSVNWGSVNIS